ncbi:AfsR/SARP family transcriptional regulator [Conexibacter woesei]|uniref:AfsR/SARP family transcriptional regulator n=1 Tax=Conexibacter woesei TaxID=191495 RepID=UPI00040D2A2D|nr:BTAD domain-containing putative transcriptional regulator [Conexibacter woesei]
MREDTLRITLLGGFSVAIDGAPVDERAWRLRKARSLVKVAALAPGRRVHRDVVAELLWPDRDATAAANNLHQVLHAARRALDAPGALTLADDVLSLTPAAWVDVDAFEDAANAAVAAPEDDAVLNLALGLYRGELLPEDRFEPWTERRRAALAETHLDLVIRSAERLAAAGDPGAGIAALARAAADAPRHEAVRRALMRALAAAGRRQDALAEFEQLRGALREHSEGDPDPETRALYRELLGADGDAPPAPEQPVRRLGALPVQATSFVGRARELEELDHLLDRERLVTLTGPGGAGKTRLALEAAARRGEEAWLADLGALRDPALVPQQVATALRVPIPANRPALDALIAHLGRAPVTLIVLDTCEHVLHAAAELADALLAAAPAVRFLATSREPLRAPAEVAWRVPSLAEAPELFRQRAGAVAGGLTGADDELIAHVCHHLDRMPLAVELAAARCGALTLAQIADRLDVALDVLGSGPRTARNRQQTLRATIAWSHDLLTGPERILFRRLAVFRGSFALGAAELVVADGAIPERRVADLVARLVDKSLVVADAERFRCMDTIRQFADEQLDAAGERDAVARRHLAWCLELARDPASLHALEDEHGNLRAALTYALTHDPQAALALAARLWRFWLDRSWFVEGTAWLDAVLRAAPERTPLRVEALLAAAGLALRRGDPYAYLRRLEETLSIYDDLGDPLASAEAAVQHALFEAYVNSSERSATMCAEAVSVAEAHGAPQVAANAAHAGALAAWQRSDAGATRRALDDAVARLRALPPAPDEPFLDAVVFGMLPLPVGGAAPAGTVRMVWEATLFPFRRLDREQALGLALNNLAYARRAAGPEDPDALGDAAAALVEALGRLRSIGDRSGEAMTLAHLGHLARTRGDLDDARARLEEAFALRQELGEGRDARVVSLGLGLVHAAAGELDAARGVFTAAVERFEATDDLPALAGTHMDWAIAEERAGDLARACELYALASGLWAGQGLPRWAAWAALGHLATLGAEGRAETGAQDVRRRTRDTFAQIGDTRGIALLASGG